MSNLSGMGDQNIRPAQPSPPQQQTQSNERSGGSQEVKTKKAWAKFTIKHLSTMKAATQWGITMIVAKAMSSRIGKHLGFKEHRAKTMEARSYRYLCKINNIWFEKKVGSDPKVELLGGKGVNIARHDAFKHKADQINAHILDALFEPDPDAPVQKFSKQGVKESAEFHEETEKFSSSSLEGVCAGTSFDWNLRFMEGCRVSGVDTHKLLQNMAKFKSDGVTAEAAGNQMLYESMTYRYPQSDKFFTSCLGDLLKLYKGDDQRIEGGDKEVKFKEVIQIFVEYFVPVGESLRKEIQDTADFALPEKSSKSGEDVTLKGLIDEVKGKSDGQAVTVDAIELKLNDILVHQKDTLNKEKTVLGQTNFQLKRSITDKLSSLLKVEGLSSDDENKLNKLLEQAKSLPNIPKEASFSLDILDELSLDGDIKEKFLEMVNNGQKRTEKNEEIGDIDKRLRPLTEQIEQLRSLVQMRGTIAEKGWSAIENHSDVYDGIGNIGEKLKKANDYHEFVEKFKVIADVRGITLEECDKTIGAPGSYDDDTFITKFNELGMGSYVFYFDLHDQFSEEDGGHACSYTNLGGGKHCFMDPNHPPYIYEGEAKDGFELLMDFYSPSKTGRYDFRIIKMSFPDEVRQNPIDQSGSGSTVLSPERKARIMGIGSSDEISTKPKGKSEQAVKRDGTEKTNEPVVAIHRLPMKKRVERLITGFESDLKKLKADNRSTEKKIKRAEGRIEDIKGTLKGTAVFSDKLKFEVDIRLNVLLTQWDAYLDELKGK